MPLHSFVCDELAVSTFFLLTMLGNTLTPFTRPLRATQAERRIMLAGHETYSISLGVSIVHGCVVAGNLARFICRTEDYIRRLSRFDVQTHGLPQSRKREVVLSRIDQQGIRKPSIGMDK